MNTPTRLFSSLAPRRLVWRAILGVSRVSRGMTLGVRAVLLKDDHIILVRHSYSPGWYFPGGGVEAGESLAEAMVREIDEEAGVQLTGPASLFGVYRGGPVHPRDHVALFVCRHWEQLAAPEPNLEIRACRSFALNALPADTSGGTRARLAEILEGQEPATDWQA